MRVVAAMLIHCVLGAAQAVGATANFLAAALRCLNE
jgi:hypothetical protein